MSPEGVAIWSRPWPDEIWSLAAGSELLIGGRARCNMDAGGGQMLTGDCSVATAGYAAEVGIGGGDYHWAFVVPNGDGVILDMAVTDTLDWLIAGSIGFERTTLGGTVLKGIAGVDGIHMRWR